MNEFESYSPVDVITANLEETDRRRRMLDEQELSHLRELACEIASTGDLSELLTTLPDHRLPNAGRNGDPGRDRRTQRSVALAAEIARLAYEAHQTAIGLYLPESEPARPSGQNRIIYQKNSYTNEAFLRLSTLLPDARAVYAHSYPASCEEVWRGTCDYCILPIENSAEGQLTSFTRLLERHELKIAASCDVFDSGNVRCTRFALLRRNTLPVFEAPLSERILEFSLPCGLSPGVGDILRAAELSHLTLLRIDTLPRLGAEGEQNTYFSFLTVGGDIRTFLLYLAMEAPHYTLIGLYPNLIQKGKT